MTGSVGGFILTIKCRLDGQNTLRRRLRLVFLLGVAHRRLGWRRRCAVSAMGCSNVSTPLSSRLSLFASRGCLFADPWRHRADHSLLRRYRHVRRLLCLLCRPCWRSRPGCRAALALTVVFLAGALGTAALGDALQRGVFSPLIKAPSQAIMIASIGVSIALQETMRLQSGGREQWLPPFGTQIAGIKPISMAFSVRIGACNRPHFFLRPRCSSRSVSF